ncbi:MAG: Membrane-associated phospholipid phosphatase [Myxococcales bacterium]|nr:Membrane-associated phospholipid phosphatase [Myxococcales bacterium]
MIDSAIVRGRSLLVVSAIAAAITVLCIFSLDEPCARWLATREMFPGFWDRGVDVLEHLALIAPWKWAGVYVLTGGVVIALAVPYWRRAAPAWMFVALTHLLARNVMMWSKLAMGRLRPPEWIAHRGGTFFRDGGYSFPSGHVMLFASIALPIAVIWPRSRLAMFAIVGFVMIARVAVNAHFISDVTGGFALTAAITYLCARLVRRASPWPTPPASPR